MNRAVQDAMLAYINDLQRSADLNETFADEVATLAKGIEASHRSVCEHGPMLELARRHRVNAIKARAKLEAITEQFVRRFGVERFEEERSRRPVRPSRLV